jgi:lipoate-protein ligase A
MFEELDMIGPEEAFDGPMQMALDEVLLSRVRRPTLRVYRWEAPCVTYGYFQPHALVEGLHPGLPSVRRWTGGGIVVHGEDLTFSLMIPSGNPISGLAPSRFYRELHGPVANVFGGRLAGDGEIADGPSCFSAPSRDDLMIGARKVLGGAIRRSGGALLYQGSFMDQEDRDDRDPAGSDVPEILATALCRKHLPRVLEAGEISSALVLSQRRYATQAWKHRR